MEPFGAFPCGSVVKKKNKNPPAMKETRFDPWVRKIPWRRKWQPTPVFLPGESCGQGIFDRQQSMESQRVRDD